MNKTVSECMSDRLSGEKKEEAEEGREVKEKWVGISPSTIYSTSSFSFFTSSCSSVASFQSSSLLPPPPRRVAKGHENNEGIKIHISTNYLNSAAISPPSKTVNAADDQTSAVTGL